MRLSQRRAGGHVSVCRARGTSSSSGWVSSTESPRISFLLAKRPPRTRRRVARREPAGNLKRNGAATGGGAGRARSDSDGGSPRRPGLRDLPRVRRSLSGGTSGGASATDPPRPATVPLSARNPPGPAAGRPVVGQLQFAFKVAARGARRRRPRARAPLPLRTSVDLRGQWRARAGHRGRGRPPPPATRSRRPSDPSVA
jgi:hypothetical protein